MLSDPIKSFLPHDCVGTGCSSGYPLAANPLEPPLALGQRSRDSNFSVSDCQLGPRDMVREGNNP